MRRECTILAIGGEAPTCSLRLLCQKRPQPLFKPQTILFLRGMSEREGGTPIRSTLLAITPIVFLNLF